MNVVGYNDDGRGKQPMRALNDRGLFNAPYLSRQRELVVAEDPVDTLLLIQNDVANATFFLESDDACLEFVREHDLKRVTFLCEGRARLFHQLARSGISTRRVELDRDRLLGSDARGYLEGLLAGDHHGGWTADAITEIEQGFLFRFPHLSYRVIGNFSEHSMHLKANVKAQAEREVFVDSLDLYKNRDRQNFVFSLMDRFAIRDQAQLENDLTEIIDVIENHKEKQRAEKQRTAPELTEHQRRIGLQLLESPKLIDEIEQDYTELGYVRERKNKLLLYLVMTSRLMENPLHAVIVSRSSAGKSMLVEMTGRLCPAEDVESISDLSAQALYYYGKDDLKHRFVVIAEQHGSQGSEYPLRELISRRSITKAVPMKDPVSGQVKTETITVNGPIALAETTTSGDVHPENLSRCFVVAIDESDEQTRRILEEQRRAYTMEGYREKRTQGRILERHHCAQRLLGELVVFNPFAQLLTFPTTTLKARRDNEKFLRLINVICFLHQRQRERNTMSVERGRTVEYIECTLDDYRLAYELLSDGVLDNTLDDLPRPARRLLDIIREYVTQRADREGIAGERVVFQRSEIRSASSWSYAQVRNSVRTLVDYECIQLVKTQSGLASQYRLNGSYSDPEFLSAILAPEELASRFKQAGNGAANPNNPNIPEHSG